MLTLIAFAGFAARGTLDHYGWHRMIVLLGRFSEDLRLTAIFLYGVCFFLFRDRIRYNPILAALALLAIVAFAIAILASFEIPFVLCFGYLLFFAGNRWGRRLKWMANIPDISYGIYLYAWPVMGLVLWFFHLTPLQAFSVAFLPVFALELASWYRIEKPMLALIPTRKR